MSIPRDYAGEPQYPEPWTTNKPREGLRDIDEARIVSLAPDVCWTPVGSSVVPIPYPVVDFCGHDKNYTPSVRFTRKKAMVMRSCTTHVHGDKPGIRKGRKSGTVESICEPIGHADQVRAEGSHVIRHLDRFYMNNKNTEGEAIFVRGSETYAPPNDDDPVPGSLVAKPVQLALDSSSPEAQEILREALRKASPKPPSNPTGVPTPTKSGSVIMRRLGMFGKVLGKVAGPLSIITSGGTPDLDNAIMANNRAKEILEGIVPMGPTETALYDQTKERIASYYRDYYEFPFSAVDEQYLDKEKEYLEASIKIERNRRLKKALENGVRVYTDEKDDWPCVVGEYRYVNMICPGEAHHIIPDMVYRIGNAPEYAADKDSTENRIPRSPTYNKGQAICLTKAMHRTDEDAVHKSLNPALAKLGSNYNPAGTAPLGKIRDEAHKALDRVGDLPEKCRRMAKDAADIQVGANDLQPGRTTLMPPKLPGGRDVIDVLKAGKY